MYKYRTYSVVLAYHFFFPYTVLDYSRPERAGEDGVYWGLILFIPDGPGGVSMDGVHLLACCFG